MAITAKTKPASGKIIRSVKVARPTPSEGNPTPAPPTTGQLYPRGVKTNS